MECILHTLRNSLNFSGRASLRELWVFGLFSLVITLCTLIMDRILGAPLIGLIVNLALLPPNVSLMARRLHDMDRSAWWLLLLLVPIAGLFVIIWMAAMPGTQGPNRYGEAPMACGAYAKLRPSSA